MHGGCENINEFILAQQGLNPALDSDFAALLSGIVRSCKSIAQATARGNLAGVTGDANTKHPASDHHRRLDAFAKETFLHHCQSGGHFAAIACGEMCELVRIPAECMRGQFLLVFEALESSLNVEVNGLVGSIFSILRCPKGVTCPDERVFLQAGNKQVCAGYALYGPATMLVLTVGNEVCGFTLDRDLGEFVLSHPTMQIAIDGQEFAIDASNERFWEPPVKRYVAECLAGKTGPRAVDFSMRSTPSMVAEVHRILLRGGLFIYSKDDTELSDLRRQRIIYEANPLAMIVEAAGGGASTGRQRILDVIPTSLRQTIPIFMGSRNEVERIDRYHREHSEGRDEAYSSPLFNTRSLFVSSH